MRAGVWLLRERLHNFHRLFGFSLFSIPSNFLIFFLSFFIFSVLGFGICLIKKVKLLRGNRHT